MRFAHLRAALGWMEVVLWAGALAAPPESLSPTANMCQRWNHQSTIKNNILYIDGGIETFVPSNSYGSPKGNVTIGTNNYLIEVDMSQSWNWQKAGNLSETFVEKTTNPATGTFPPQVIRGGLYSGAAGDSKIYLYGGTTSGLNKSFPGYQYPPSSQYSLWSYDTKTEIWDQYDTTLETPQRPNGGASVEAPDQGLAFFYNGQVDNGTSIGTTNMNGTDAFLTGMVVIDTATATTRNISTPNNSTGGNPLSRAQMTYLPGIGEKGILVSLGGSWKNATEVDNTDIGTMVSMDTVTIFDIASLDNGGDGIWYEQQTSGDTPSPRVDHCVVAVSAPDNSSHQISIYGGRSSDNELVDDIWTLSVPAFRWTKVYSGNSPRYGHSCHVVGNRQMLTVGGSLSPPNNITHGCDWETKGVAIWDMSLRQWGQVFNAYAAPYTVPDLVTQDIGGTGAGGANFTIPTNGFSNQGLATLFNTTRFWPGASNTTSSNSTSSASMGPTSTLSSGAIAGIVIGGLVCLALVITGCFIRYLSLRRRARAGSSQSNVAPLAEVDGSEVQEKDGLSTRSYSNSGRSQLRPRAINSTGSPAELHSPDAAAAELYSPNERVEMYSPGPNQVAELAAASSDSLYRRQGRESIDSMATDLTVEIMRVSRTGSAGSAGSHIWKPLPPAPGPSPMTPTEPEPAHLPGWVVRKGETF